MIKHTQAIRRKQSGLVLKGLKVSFLNTGKILGKTCLMNSFLRVWKCGGGPRTAATSNMEHFLTLVYTAATSCISVAATASDLQMYANILYAISEYSNNL